MQAVLDEVIEEIGQFSDGDRDKLIQILQSLERALKTRINKKSINTASDEDYHRLIQSLKNLEKALRAKNKKGSVHPNTIWINEHYTDYAGKYVALKEGELIAFGETLKEADLKAKEKGVKNPLLTYLPREDEEIFCGGWL